MAGWPPELSRDAVGKRCRMLWVFMVELLFRVRIMCFNEAKGAMMGLFSFSSSDRLKRQGAYGGGAYYGAPKTAIGAMMNLLRSSMSSSERKRMAYRQPAAPYTRPVPTSLAQGSCASSASCPRCGSAIPAGSKFCLACGQKVGGGFCAGCGAPLPADARFCPSCGTPRR